MGAALSLLVILTLAVLITRIASVTLRLTGLPDSVARFQASSALTGAGFTTAESETVVNYPIRRRVISLLMIGGNVGLVTVAATLIVSFVSIEGSMAAVSRQVVWLLGALVLLWIIALNPIADRIMCRSIGWLLRRTTDLGRHGPTTLLQLARGHTVAEHRVWPIGGWSGRPLSDLGLPARGLVVIGIKHDDGRFEPHPEPETRLAPGARLVLYGSEHRHAALHQEMDP